MRETLKSPLFIRPLSEDQRHHIQAGLRPKDAFVLRRCQILLACDREPTGKSYREPVGLPQTDCPRVLIHGFDARGLAVLQEGSSQPHRLRTTFTDEAVEALQDLSGTMLAFHISNMVRKWIGEHNQHVKRTGKGVHILPFLRALAKSLAQKE
jgi:hypothetical protein